MPMCQVFPRGPNGSPTGAWTGTAKMSGLVGTGAAQARERRRPGEAVRAEPGPRLEAPQRRVGARAEPAVHRAGREAVAAEQELQLGDVPPALPGVQRAAAQRRPPAPAERPPRPRPGDAVGDEPAARLEAAHGGARLRPADAVDRARVDALRAQRHLERGRVGAPGSGRRRQHQQEQDSDAPGSGDGPTVSGLMTPRGPRVRTGNASVARTRSAARDRPRGVGRDGPCAGRRRDHDARRMPRPTAADLGLARGRRADQGAVAGGPLGAHVRRPDVRPVGHERDRAHGRHAHRRRSRAAVAPAPPRMSASRAGASSPRSWRPRSRRSRASNGRPIEEERAGDDREGACLRAGTPRARPPAARSPPPAPAGSAPGARARRRPSTRKPAPAIAPAASSPSVARRRSPRRPAAAPTAAASRVVSPSRKPRSCGRRRIAVPIPVSRSSASVPSCVCATDQNGSPVTARSASPHSTGAASASANARGVRSHAA